MLRHALGREVIYFSLQHFIAPFLKLMLCLSSWLDIIACLPSRCRREAIRAVIVPYPQLQGYSNLLGNSKDFFISYVLDKTLDNNMFKRLDHCVSLNQARFKPKALAICVRTRCHLSCRALVFNGSLFLNCKKDRGLAKNYWKFRKTYLLNGGNLPKQ